MIDTCAEELRVTFTWGQAAQDSEVEALQAQLEAVQEEHTRMVSEAEEAYASAQRALAELRQRYGREMAEVRRRREEEAAALQAQRAARGGDRLQLQVSLLRRC